MRRYGLLQGCYLGLAKTEFQTAMTVDAKRLLILAAADSQREQALRQGLSACSRAFRTLPVMLQRRVVSPPALPVAIESAPI